MSLTSHRFSPHAPVRDRVSAVPRRLRALAGVAALATLVLPAASGAFSVSRASGGRLVAPGLSAPEAIADGDGGVIISARDGSTGTTVVNRYSASGARLWDQGISYEDTNGVQLEPDGAGGAIVGVERAEPSSLMLARILSGGATTWQASFPPGILAAGGDGGAWVLSQSGELFADGITSAGAPRSRVQVTTSADNESLPAATGDGDGGAYLAWRSSKNDTQFAIELQHLRADGTLWQQAAQVAGSSEPGIAPSVAPDGRGGVLVSWYAAGYLWVHNYDADGLPRWNQVVTLPAGAARSNVVAADQGGVYVVWSMRLRAHPLAVDLVKVTYVGPTGATHWTQNAGTADGGVLDLRATSAAGAVVVGWQTALIPVIGAAIDTDLHIARIKADGAPAYEQSALASSLGPEAFGSIVDGKGGSVLAVFTQSPCLRADVSGVAIQRIRPDGTRDFGADGSCP